MPDRIELPFIVEAVEGDALAFMADVLLLKDAPRSGGLDAVVRRLLTVKGQIAPKVPRLAPGEASVYAGVGVAQARQVVLVGSPSVFDLDYAAIRAWGRSALNAVKELADAPRHVVTTAHGIQTSLALDETEALRALVLGFADAVAEGAVPPQLERLTIIERKPQRADLFARVLTDLIGSAPAVPPQLDYAPPAPAPVLAGAVREKYAKEEADDQDVLRPVADDTTPYVFVAMPFSDAYDDQFYLAIQPGVKGAGLLCERMDLDVFTGDIMERMFARIRSARIVIALLDGANPNVYLEVGYAWCAGTPTILAAHRDEKLPFDVQSHRILFYDKIYLLKQMLEREIQLLLNEEKL